MGSFDGNRALAALVRSDAKWDQVPILAKCYTDQMRFR